MEIALYVCQIRFICNIAHFLKNFDRRETHKNEIELIKQGRVILLIAGINISIMMITNSFFSVISPYLWFGEVFSKSDLLVHLYFASTELFYIANTFFACLTLYVIYNFDTLDVNVATTTSDLQH